MFYHTLPARSWIHGRYIELRPSCWRVVPGCVIPWPASYNPDIDTYIAVMLRDIYIYNNIYIYTFAHTYRWLLDFSRMRSKGSRFTLGVWGLRVCSLDVASASATVRNRSQPFATVFATVRNRSQPSVRGPYGRAYGKFCRGGHFWRFQTCRCFVSRGRHGTS